VTDRVEIACVDGLLKRVKLGQQRGWITQTDVRLRHGQVCCQVREITPHP